MTIYADYIIYNASIITMNPMQPKASAMGIKDGKIYGIGDRYDVEMLIGPDTKKYNMFGKTVMPGLNDNHCHTVAFADNLAKIDFSKVKTHDEFLAKLKERADVTPVGEWVLGYAYDEMNFPEKKEPSIEELDRVVPNHPVLVARACLHTGLCNSMALKIRGWNADTPSPPGGEIVRDGKGKITGRINESAKFLMDEVVAPRSEEKIADSMKEMSRIYNSYGVTSVADMGIAAEKPEYLKVWGLAIGKGNVSVRVSAYLMDHAYRAFCASGLPFPIGDDLFRIAGRKLMADGAIGAGTASVSKPNTMGSYGLLHHSQEEMDELVWEAHSKRRQISIHAMGDEGIRLALNSLKKAQDRLPLSDMRHRIEHCSFADEDIINRLVDQKVYPLFNSGLYWYFGEAHIHHYGMARIEGQYPFNTAMGRDLPVANGTDCPVTSPDPWPVIYTAAVRKTSSGKQVGTSERISVEKAFRTYTANGAFLTFDEKKKGTLETGKYADYIVIGRDPLVGEPETILNMPVERTVLGGEIVFEK